MSEKDIQITDSNKNNIYPITKLKNITHENSNAEHALSDSESNIQTESNKIFNAIKSLQDSLGNVKTSSGNAKSEDVLEGKTFSNKDGTDLTGTMKNYGDKIITPNKSIQTFNKGFYNNIKINPVTTDTVKNNLSDNEIINLAKEKMPELKPENIANGINIGGINGNAIIKKSASNKTISNDQISYSNIGDNNQGKYTFNIGFYPTSLVVRYGQYVFILTPTYSEMLTQYMWDGDREAKISNYIQLNSNGFSLRGYNLPNSTSIKWYASN